MVKLLLKLWDWFDDRTGISAVAVPMLKHKVPPGSAWLYALGSATLFAFILQVVTGMCLALSYVPSAGQAFDSLKYISEKAMFGGFLRGLHYFGASAMVLLV